MDGQTTIRMSNSLNPDQTQLFVGHALGLNCWQRLSTVATSGERVNVDMTLSFIILLGL